LLLYLEEDIIAIQDKLDIISYINQEMVEKADKNTKTYLQKFKKFYDSLEDDLDIVLEKFGEVGVKKIWFIKKELLLFLKLSS